MTRDNLDLKKLEQRVQILENQVDNSLSSFVVCFAHHGSPEHLAFMKRIENDKHRDGYLIITGPKKIDELEARLSALENDPLGIRE